MTVDFAVAQGWPFIFVLHGALGSVNHALLSFEALVKRGAKVETFVYNTWPGRKDPLINEDTRRLLHAEAAKAFPGAAWLEMPILEGV